jgi:hypothetical protein
MLCQTLIIPSEQVKGVRKIRTAIPVRGHLSHNLRMLIFRLVLLREEHVLLFRPEAGCSCKNENFPGFLRSLIVFFFLYLYDSLSCAGQ